MYAPQKKYLIGFVLQKNSQPMNKINFSLLLKLSYKDQHYKKLKT